MGTEDSIRRMGDPWGRRIRFGAWALAVRQIQYQDYV